MRYSGRRPWVRWIDGTLCRRRGCRRGCVRCGTRRRRGEEMGVVGRETRARAGCWRLKINSKREPNELDAVNYNKVLQSSPVCSRKSKLPLTTHQSQLVIIRQTEFHSLIFLEDDICAAGLCLLSTAPVSMVAMNGILANDTPRLIR